MNTTVLFVIGLLILLAVFLVWMAGMMRRRNDDAMLIDVACAGSVDSDYPAKAMVKNPQGSVPLENKQLSDHLKELKKFVVKGNSMQYAKINSDDIIFVEPISLDSLKNDLPRVTLLSFTPSADDRVGFKIRRTWKVVSRDISRKDFHEILDQILASDDFKSLKNEMGHRCPQDDELKQRAYLNFRDKRAGSSSEDNEILISTTFRTERDCLEFSIHPSSSFKGIVKYISRRKK